MKKFYTIIDAYKTIEKQRNQTLFITGSMISQELDFIRCTLNLVHISVKSQNKIKCFPKYKVKECCRNNMPGSYFNEKIYGIYV